MSEELRIILVFASIVTCVYIQRKLKKAQVRGYDTIYWLLLSALMIVVSVFPGIADWGARMIGIYSSENMVFLIMIFALLIRVFLMTLKVSRLENRVTELVEELAIREKMAQEQETEWSTTAPRDP